MVSIISGGQLGDSVSTAELENNAVTTAKITDANVTTAKIADEAVTSAKLDDESWRLLETLTFSSEQTKTTGTLDAYDSYLITFLITNMATAREIMNIRVNGLSTGVYTTSLIKNGAILHASGQTELQLCSEAQVMGLSGRVVITGKSCAIANGEAGFSNGCYGSTGSTNPSAVFLGGSVQLGNAVQITTITLFANTGNITGHARIYGGNRGA